MSDSKSKRKPGRWLYAVAVLLIVEGVALAGSQAAVGAKKALQTAAKVQVPGKSTVELTKTGTYSLTFTADAEGKAVANPSAFKGLNFTLTDPDGNPVNVKSVANGVRTFQIPDAGTYTLDAEYASGSGESAIVAVMAVSGISTVSVRAALWGFVTAGIVLIIVTAVLRKKDGRRRLEQ